MNINEELKRILVEPCEEDAPHALRWCVASGSKRKSRALTGKDFSTMIYNLMSWDEHIRYKVLGFRIQIEKGVYAYLFRLDYPEKFDILPAAPKKKKKEANPTSDETDAHPSETPPKRATSKGYYDQEALNAYGIPYEQYVKDTSVVERDGYVQMGMLTGGQGGAYGNE